MRLFLSLWIAAICAVAPVCPQAPPDTVIRTTAQEVLLDLVVRDKRANLIRDLKPEEVEVYEDGVKQTIRVFHSFTDKAQLNEEVTAGQAMAAGQTARTRTLNPMRQVNLVSLVFNSMGPRSRDFARNAAVELLQKEIGPNTYMAVFSLDTRLNVLQQFTADKDLIRKAVDRIATGTYSQFAQESSKILNQIQSALILTEGGIATTVDPVAVMLAGPSASIAGAETGVGEANQMIARMLYGQSLMGVADVEGMRVVEALKLMVTRHEPLPGRKTVLFFSEGLVLPTTNLQMFQNTIAAANRANVSIYGMDVRGLTTQLSSAGSASQLQNAARLSQRRQLESNGDNFRPEDFKQEEMISAGFKSNYQQNLAELAEGTGGFLIANTNDLRKPLAQLMEDVRTHYELSYAPVSSNYDGKFRKIEVKLTRPGLKVQTRSGYYALPKLAGATIEPFEMAALSALNARPRPAARPFRASALRLRGDAQFSRYAVNFEVPMADLMVTNSADGKSARIHVSMLALIKDETGQVVRKVSRDVYVDVPQDRLAGYRKGNVTYGQQIYLAGGRYTMETAVVDHEGNAASARQSVLLVPQSMQLLSHLTLVRRVEPPTAERDAADPLQYSAGKVIPALSDHLKAGAPVSLYMLLNPEKDGGPAVLQIQMMKDGVEVANETPVLDKPDANGIIPFMMSANLNPGTYDVRAVVRQGNKIAEERTAFTVEP
ncbi:MAG TPA: VWA domain-containing protein [Paludibaculum sp.]